MRKITGFGLAAAAVVAAALIGIQLLGNGRGVAGGGTATATAEPSPTPQSSVAKPSRPAEIALPVGPFAWVDPAATEQPYWFEPEFDDGPPITVTIPAPGWVFTDSFNLLQGDEVHGLNESKFIWTSTTHAVLVYGDPCQWESSAPETPATTVEEIAAALTAQPSRDASDPVDVTIGGYAAQRVTLHVPDDAVFTDCDRGQFASFTLEGFGEGPWRSHDGPGQIDTFWIVDVDGAIVIIDAMYRHDTPAERVEEMRSIAESAAFEAR